MKFRELLRNLALSVTVTIVFLGLIEGGIRIARMAPSRTLSFPDEKTWEKYPGPFEPGQSFVDRLNPRLPHRITINALGFRGEDFDEAKAPGVLRILCLGDSYTFGDYVNDDETFPAALQAELRRRLPGRKLEVINGGVNGYTITDEAALAREKGFALHPDVIVLGFVMNDLADLTRKVSSRDNQRNEAREMSRSYLTPIKRILRQTALYNWLFEMKARVMAETKMDPTLQQVPQENLMHPPFGPRTEALFSQYASALDALAADCRARGIRLVFVIFPFYQQVVKGAPADAQTQLSEIGREAGLPVVDLLPSFLGRGATAGDLFLMPLNHHPSAEGYRVAAGVVGAEIVSIVTP